MPEQIGDRSTITMGGRLCIREFMGGVNGNRVYRRAGYVLRNGNYRNGNMLPLVTTLTKVDGVTGGGLCRYVFLTPPAGTFQALCVQPTATMVLIACDSCAIIHRSTALHCSANVGLSKSPLDVNVMYSPTHKRLFTFKHAGTSLVEGRVSSVSLRVLNI